MCVLKYYKTLPLKIKIFNETGEVAQSVKYLPSKHE